MFGSKENDSQRENERERDCQDHGKKRNAREIKYECSGERD